MLPGHAPFENDPDFLEVLKLPFYQPPNVTVCPKPEKIGKGHYTDLNIHRNGAPAFGIHEATRELIQNLIDGAADMNGDTHRGIMISRGFSKGYNTTIIHDRFVCFAEIKQSVDTITFTNFGNIIASPQALFAYGYSTKNEKFSQAGKYGEGLKISLLRFLAKKSAIEIFACMPNPKCRQDIEYNRFNMKLVDEGTMGTIQTRRKPDFRPGAPIHFMVQIKTECLANRVDVRQDFVIPFPQLLTHIEEDDPGNLILDPAYQGFVYVKHILLFKCKKSKMLFSYDFFDIETDRDRRSFNDFQDAAIAMAAIWDKNMVTHGRAFFDAVINVKNGALPDHTYEKFVTQYLSPASLAILHGFLTDGGKKLAITAEYASEFDRRFNCEPIILAEHARDVVLGSFQQLVDVHGLFLKSCQDIVVNFMTLKLGKLFHPILFELCNCPETSFIYYYDKARSTLRLNLCALEARDYRSLVYFIAFQIIPFIDVDMNFQFLEDALEEESKKILPAVVPAPPVAVVPPAVKEVKPPIVNESPSVSDGEDEEEESEKNIHGKRSPPGDLRDGYEWTRGWIVRKK